MLIKEILKQAFVLTFSIKIIINFIFATPVYLYVHVCVCVNNLNMHVFVHACVHA